MATKLVECVPNFSEGRNMQIIDQITAAIRSVEGVRLLDTDPGRATNRTVVTFVGEPEPVIEAAFRAISRASELIDMRSHKGEHPRMGATDVCPLIPVANVSMDEVVSLAHRLGERVGRELNIPVYYYEHAATSPRWKNLAAVRKGEYEGLAARLIDTYWKPDAGPARFNARSGATAIGARDFLIAYNVNLNTSSVRRANSVAFDVREKGRIKRKGDPITGEIVRDSEGEPERLPGECKSVKAIGWYIEEYGIAQISMNLTNIADTSLHEAFEACRRSAMRRGLRVTGSELVGMVPLRVLLEAGKYYLRQQRRSLGIPDREIVDIAIRSLGLDELSPFDPEKKIIEYALGDDSEGLVDQTLLEFANRTASESPAPGGGSVAAYLGALAAALGTMVANLSSHKRGWDDRWEEFSDWAVKGQMLKSELLSLVDEDTEAFNAILQAVRMPAQSGEQQAARAKAIDNATRRAIDVPLRVMRTCSECFPLLEAMARDGNPSSASDAGVGALACRAAIRGAHLNVMTNLADLDDEKYRVETVSVADELAGLAEAAEQNILNAVKAVISDRT